MYKCYTYSNPTPLATIASQALSGPASFLADGTLWVAWQVAFAPVVLVVDQGQLFAWDVRGILLTVSNSKVLAIPVYKVLTNCEQTATCDSNKLNVYNLSEQLPNWSVFEPKIKKKTLENFFYIYLQNCWK